MGNTRENALFRVKYLRGGDDGFETCLNDISRYRGIGMVRV